MVLFLTQRLVEVGQQAGIETLQVDPVLLQNEGIHPAINLAQKLAGPFQMLQHAFRYGFGIIFAQQLGGQVKVAQSGGLLCGWRWVRLSNTIRVPCAMPPSRLSS